MRPFTNLEESRRSERIRAESKGEYWDKPEKNREIWRETELVCDFTSRQA